MLANGNMMLALAQTKVETRNVYFNVVDHNLQEIVSFTIALITQ